MYIYNYTTNLVESNLRDGPAAIKILILPTHY